MWGQAGKENAAGHLCKDPQEVRGRQDLAGAAGFWAGVQPRRDPESVVLEEMRH